MKRSLWVGLVLTILMGAVPAHAEVGDYSGFQSFWNVFFPPAADNPVDQELEDRFPFELLDNPSGFDDGFHPGRYGQWQTVVLSPATGAMCGDGSPYEFLVNRSNASSNQVIFFEGGGACWDQRACDAGQTSGGILSFLDEIPFVGGFLADLIQPFLSEVTSLATLSFGTGLKTERWTKVYLPYCTQDVHLGDAVRVYDDADPSAPLVVHHRGGRVQAAVITWLKSNLERPGQILVTGQSAGGFGAQAMYHPYRLSMEPSRGYFINDSGPVMPAPRGADPDAYPSAPLHARARAQWDLDDTLQWFEGESAAFDRDDLSTSAAALSDLWPDDRLGLATFQRDRIIEGFSYNAFFPEILAERDKTAREALREELRFRDLARLTPSLEELPNFGFFLAGYREEEPEVRKLLEARREPREVAETQLFA